MTDTPAVRSPEEQRALDEDIAAAKAVLHHIFENTLRATHTLCAREKVQLARGFEAQHQKLVDAESEVRTLRAELQRVREALAFYAARVGGRRAREALSGPLPTSEREGQ